MIEKVKEAIEKLRDVYLTVKEAIGSMRYEGGIQTNWYQIIRILLIVDPLLIVLCIVLFNIYELG